MTLTIKQLKESITQMAKQDMDWDVIDFSLNILMDKISEKDFVEFCASLEEYI